MQDRCWVGKRHDMRKVEVYDIEPGRKSLLEFVRLNYKLYHNPQRLALLQKFVKLRSRLRYASEESTETLLDDTFWDVCGISLIYESNVHEILSICIYTV